MNESAPHIQTCRRCGKEHDTRSYPQTFNWLRRKRRGEANVLCVDRIACEVPTIDESYGGDPWQ